jgi:toxin ParE1/3/4
MGNRAQASLERMTLSLIISPAAEIDIGKAIEWYDALDSRLSGEFRRVLHDTLQRIADNPDAYVIVTRGLRRALLRHFPHGVYYRKDRQAIQVVGVLHTARDPRVWLAREH